MSAPLSGNAARHGPGDGAAAAADDVANTHAIVEPAPAKINLTLEILGRRADGYHALRSLVGFFTPGDTLAFTPGGALALRVDGPFATRIEGDNLVLRVARACLAASPHMRAGTFHLTKLLPVAAGVGGGSSDAAAAIRALCRDVATRGLPIPPPRVLDDIAAAFGSDINVCLEPAPAEMSGRGEVVRRLPVGASVPALLVNPGVPLSTAAVFAALGAPPVGPPGNEPQPERLGTPAEVIAAMARHGNGLAATATRLVPEIAAVLAALRAEPRCLIAQMAGSGPTCFALLEGTAHEAEAAAARLRSHHPLWWVASGEIALPGTG